MKMILQAAAEVLYLFAPLLLSAAMSGLVLRYEWFVFLRKPLDAKRSWRGKRIFGDSKTWRGVLTAVVGCIAGAAVQKYLLADCARSLARLDYTTLNVWVFGSVFGTSAMLGELPNSFVKRRLGIKPGGTTRGVLAIVFYLWDQLDLLMFSWPALCVWIEPDFTLIATSVGVTLALHPLTSLIGFAIGARRSAR